MPVADPFAVAGLATAVTGGVLVRAWFWPYGHCPHCRNRTGKGRNWGSSKTAWGRCHHCGGKGERIRLTSRIYPKYRAEARQNRRKR